MEPLEDDEILASQPIHSSTSQSNSEEEEEDDGDRTVQNFLNVENENGNIIDI